MKLAEGHASYILVAAQHGGYAVACDARYDPLYQSGPLFAGSLDECLAYIKASIAKHYEPAGPEAPQ